MKPASRVIAMLSVSDLGRSRAMYEGVLGGQKIYQFPPEGEPGFMTLSFGDTELGLGVLGDGVGVHGRTLRPATGHRVELCFNVEDVDATLAALEKLGLPVAMAPVDQPWGERAAYIEDPDGNLVMLVAPVKAAR
jgi:lactoylglutathione lyase